MKIPGFTRMVSAPAAPAVLSTVSSASPAAILLVAVAPGAAYPASIMTMVPAKILTAAFMGSA